MVKTTDVANDRAYDDDKTVLPAEFARGVYIERVPSAQAMKLMHLMIAVAGGRMADDVMHEMRGAEIRQIKGMRKHSKESLVPLFSEIRAVTVIYDDELVKEVTIGGFLDAAKIDYRYDDHGEIIIRWWFSRTFRDTARDSTHWAIMDRQTVFALRSKYSIQLFQYVASRAGQRYKTSERLSAYSLRGILAVPEGKLTRFADLNKYALKVAVAEINQLSRFTLTVEPITDGRYISGVEISWVEKIDSTPVKNELNRPKAGREARRTGTVEQAQPIATGNKFPESGSIEFSAWAEIARDCLPAPCPDIDYVATAYRRWTTDKNIPRHEDTWRGFCRGWK